MSESTITRVLHQIWLGESEPSYSGSGFLTNNSDWIVKYWDDEEANKFIDTLTEFKELCSFYKQTQRVIIKADILRLLIIYKFGGLYADHDISFFRSVNSLLCRDELIFFRERGEGIV